MTGVLTRSGKFGQRHTGRCHVKMDAEIGVKNLETKE